MDIRSQIDEDTAKKILGNRSRAIEYLRWLRPELKTTQTAAFTAVVDTWDYETSKNIIREMFRKSDKYRRGQAAYSAMTEYIKEWNELALGSLSWPFSQGDFDGFVQRVNSSKTTSGEDKDEETKKAAIKYRRIKEINTVRNDFIETLIFEKSRLRFGGVEMFDTPRSMTHPGQYMAGEELDDTHPAEDHRLLSLN
jgi:hypothetical protein